MVNKMLKCPCDDCQAVVDTNFCKLHNDNITLNSLNSSLKCVKYENWIKEIGKEND
jgi:hypothetical protein